MQMMNYISFFDQQTTRDSVQFGGKNAALGSMVQDLSAQGIRVPFGFATSVDAYWKYLDHYALRPRMQEILDTLTHYDDEELLRTVSSDVQQLILDHPLPDFLAHEIIYAYDQLSLRYGEDQGCDVAVRSSATAEDSPGASFAGQQETFLHIVGHDALLDACLRCFASLFTPRAIAYRREKKFIDMAVGMSIGIQKMVRSDKATAGIMFTLDTESGFSNVVTITAGYGLGEAIVQGSVNPDEFVVHKPLLKKGFKTILRKVLGSKEYKLVYGDRFAEEAGAGYLEFVNIKTMNPAMAKTMATIMHPEFSVREQEVSQAERDAFCITDDEACELAHYALIIEEYYSRVYGHWTPMDIEWAKDGGDGQLYIVQARPETVFSMKSRTHEITRYEWDRASMRPLLTGQSVGYGMASGVARVMDHGRMPKLFVNGDILVTDMTDPDVVPLLRRAGGLITNRGGRTCHAAIISRELGIPAVIGTKYATEKIMDGQEVTLDCSQGSLGYVYAGKIPFKAHKFALDGIPDSPVPLYVNLGEPDSAFRTALLPVDGVGLARVEFIIASLIGVHPMACMSPERVTDAVVIERISERLRCGPEGWRAAFVHELSHGIAMIAGAFYPRPVTVRCSDFKSNEYRQLLGGSIFEGIEENPMLGFRGAARYVSSTYAEAFALECAAIKHVRETLGLDNISVLIPFVRAEHEAKVVSDLVERSGLHRTEGLQVLMMVETPENVLNLEKYLPYFDGFSIGSNDLTQLTLGVDRDSAHVSHLFDEKQDAVIALIKMAIQKARAAGKPIGICGQGPSDFPELAEVLIAEGISYISLSPDAVIPFLLRVSTRA